jgi:hypothetical protein
MIGFFVSSSKRLPDPCHTQESESTVFLLEEQDEQTDDDGEECNTFDERGCHDHVRTDIAYAFGLTGNGFEGAGADLSNTDTCSDGCDTSTNTSTHLGNGSKVCCFL